MLIRKEFISQRIYVSKNLYLKYELVFFYYTYLRFYFAMRYVSFQSELDESVLKVSGAWHRDKFLLVEVAVSLYLKSAILLKLDKLTHSMPYVDTNTNTQLYYDQ